MSPPRLHIIACRIFQRELEALGSTCSDMSLHYLEMGLHAGTPEELHAALQHAVDGTPHCQTIALAYGLCNRGIIGLRAAHRPLAIPRAHDCLALFLGSSQRYLRELHAHPGTYFQSPGWIENLPVDGTLRQQNLPAILGPGVTLEDLIARYGSDNAAYLIDQFTSLDRHYDRLAYIATPVPQSPICRNRTAEIACDHRWSFTELPSNLRWLERLLTGPWDTPDFLLVPPHHRVVARHDGTLIAAEP